MPIREFSDSVIPTPCRLLGDCPDRRLGQDGQLGQVSHQSPAGSHLASNLRRHGVLRVGLKRIAFHAFRRYRARPATNAIGQTLTSQPDFDGQILCETAKKRWGDSRIPVRPTVRGLCTVESIDQRRVVVLHHEGGRWTAQELLPATRRVSCV
jgi:hypothetical protein